MPRGQRQQFKIVALNPTVLTIGGPSRPWCLRALIYRIKTVRDGRMGVVHPVPKGREVRGIYLSHGGGRLHTIRECRLWGPLYPLMCRGCGRRVACLKGVPRPAVGQPDSWATAHLWPCVRPPHTSLAFLRYTCLLMGVCGGGRGYS